MSMLVRLIFALTASLLLYGQEDGVPVVIDGQEVARVYGSVGTFSAADRVPEIERRIVALAEKWSGGEIATRVMPAENATAVVAGPIIIMAVTALDADSAGMPQAELAQRYAAAIQKTMEGYRARIRGATCWRAPLKRYWRGSCSASRRGRWRRR